MIGRIWHGWTTPQSSTEKYEGPTQRRDLLSYSEGRRSRIQRYPAPPQASGGGEVEFVTIMWFASWDAVRQFAGEDYERAYVPPAAREVLARFDERSQHYEIKESLEY